MSRLGALHLTKYTGNKHTATVIFFHGSGASGSNMTEWVEIFVKNFSFPHINVLYPTAPLQPYTPAGGLMSNVWFDRQDISATVPEILDSLEKIKEDVQILIKKEHDAGIPSHRIIVGGFSMGGALALHTAYRWNRNFAAAFALSSFLNYNSVVYRDLAALSDGDRKLPPLLQLHGDRDDVVKLEWGQDTFNQLSALGVEGEFHALPNLTHAIDRRGIEMVKKWIEEKLPVV